MAAYLPPLSTARWAVLDSLSVLPQEELALDPLHSVLTDIPCTEEPVVVMGDLNARVAARCPDLPDHPPHTLVDIVVNSRGPAFLWLCEEMGMWLLHGTSENYCRAISFHSLSYTAAQSVVDHALASPVAYALGVSLHVEDSFLDPSDHGILRVHLPAPASLPPATAHPSGKQVFVCWDPGSKRAWAQCLPEHLEPLHAELQLGDPDTEAAALE